MPILNFKKGVIHLAIIVFALIGLTIAAGIATYAKNSTQRKLDKLHYYQTLCAKQNSNSNSCKQAAKLQAQIDKDNAKGGGSGAGNDSSVYSGPAPFPRPPADSPGPCTPIADVNDDSVVNDNDRVRILEYNASSWSRRPHIAYTIPAPSGATAASTDLEQGHKFYLLPGRGDLNFNGKVDATDARLLKDYINGYMNTFPACDHPMPSPLPNAPAWANQGQLSLSAPDAGVTSAKFAWNGQIATGGTLELILWKGACVHPLSNTEYYANTSKIFDYGSSPRIWWDAPSNTYTFRNLAANQSYCAYFTAGLNNGLKAYSNDISTTTRQSSAGTYIGMDSDGDTFLDRLEEAIGTDPNAACGVNAWPPDFNNDHKITTADMTTVINKVSKGYDRRYDLNNDGVVNIDDVTIVQGVYNKTCS